MTYDVNYFINKFSAIPEEKWMLYNWGEDEVHCAGGHCGMRVNIGKHTDEYSALSKLLFKVLDYNYGIPDVNDGECPRYKQATPKQRILAALQDIKKLNSEPLVKECDATKVKKDIDVGKIKTVIKYVSVPESIQESLPEPILS